MKQVVRLRIDLVAAKVVALEKFGPELLLGHVVRHVLHVLLLDCRVRLEYGLYVVERDVVDEAVGAVGLRAYVRLKIMILRLNT